LLVEAAQVTVRCDPRWRNQFFHLAMRRGRKIAKVAMARRLAVRLYWMWRRGWNYEQLESFGSHPPVLFHEVFLEQIARPLRTFLAQQNRFCFCRGIRNVTLLMKSIEDIPTVTFPRPPSWFVFESSQVQQS
jgi:hypothetical protein